MAASSRAGGPCPVCIECSACETCVDSMELLEDMSTAAVMGDPAAGPRGILAAKPAPKTAEKRSSPRTPRTSGDAGLDITARLRLLSSQRRADCTDLSGLTS